MSLTTDPNDPRLGRGVDTEKIPQHEVYLVLSEEEKAKGFIRPVRTSYLHKGTYVGPTYRLLSGEEKSKLKQDYVAFAPSAENDGHTVGTYMTQYDLDTFKDGYVGGCGVVTSMGLSIAETYARDPYFYGATYCIHCQKHLPVDEFLWVGTNEKVGS